MSSPVVGTARIEVLGDLSPMAAEMDAELQAAAGKLAAEFGKVFGPAMEEEMAAVGATSGEVFAKGVSGPLKASEAKMAAAGRAAGAGYTDGAAAGMAAGAPKVAEAGAVQGRAAAKATAEQGAVAGRGFAARLKETLMGSHMITGAIFAGIGYEAVKMAGDFQTGMVRLVTAAGETKANLAAVSAGVLDISRQTGVSTHQLADGMYMVESAGYHGKAGLAVMKAAAQGAKVDMADANVVANALTTALTDMGKQAGTPADMMSKLVATVGHGKMTMDELASSIHSVLPNAAALGLSFAQTAGAVATMTAQGISAQQATQNLNHAILSLANPTAVQTKTMAAFGINASNVAKNLGKVGLTGTLDELQRTILAHMGPAGLTLTKALNSSEIAGGKVKTMFGSLPPDVKKLAEQMEAGEISAAKYTRAVNKLTADHSVLGRQFMATYNRAHGFADILKQASPDAMTFSAAMAKMTGGQVGLQVALHLTGENMKTYRANVAAINAAHAEAGGNVEGWAEKQRTFNQVMDKVKASVKAAMIEIGTKLLPVMTDLGNVLVNNVFPAIGSVVGALNDVYHYVQDHQSLMTFVAMIGGAAAAFTAWKFAVGAWSLVTKAAIVVQKAFNAATSANPIMLAVMAIAALAAGAVYAYQHFKPFRDIVDSIGRFLRTVFLGGVAGAVAAFHALSGAAQSVGGFFARMWRDVTGIVSGIPGWLHDHFVWAKQLIAAELTLTVLAVERKFHQMVAAVTGVGSSIGHAVSDAWNKVLSTTTRILDSIGAFIHRHWRLLLTIVTAGVGLIYIIIQDHWKQISGFFARIYHDVTGWVGRMWHDVVGVWNRVYADVTGVVSRVWRAVVGVWNRIYADVAAVVSRMWRNEVAFWSRIYNDVAGVATRLWRAVVGIWNRIYADVTGVASRLWHAVGGFFARIYNDVSGWVARMWHQAVAAWTRGYNDVAGVTSQAWRSVSGFFARIYNDVTGWVSRLWRQVTFYWDAGYTAVSSVASKIWHGVTGFFGRMSNDVVGGFKAMVGGVKFAWDQLKNIVAAPIRWVVDTVYDKGIVPLWNAVAGVLHEPGMKLDPVHFARGGVVPGDRRDGDNVPIYATAGEVVVPLDVVNAHGGPHGLMGMLGFGPRSGGSGDHFIWGGGVVGDIGSGIAGGAKAVGRAASGAAGAVGHAAGSLVGDLSHLARGVLAAGLAPGVHRLESMADSFLNPLGGVGHLMDLGVHNIGDRVLNWARGDDKKLAASVAGSAGGAARWAPIVSQVLAMLGIPGSALNGVLSLINKESGGDPNIVNRTDANAAAGHPSIGLMQTIGSTFAAYAGPYASRGITDPLANIYAGVNYAMHRYGIDMLAAGGNHDAAGNYVGYDTGGILKPGQVGKNYGTQPERILTPAQTRSFDALVALLGSSAWARGIPGAFSSSTGKLGLLQRDLGKFGDRLLGDHTNDRLQAFLTHENRMLLNAAATRTNIASKLAAANQRLSDAITNRTNYSNTVRGNAMGYGAITATPTTALYSGSIIGSMKDRLARLVAYRAGLRKLAGMGLNAQSYQELVDAGPDQGQYFVTALLNGGKGDLAQVNRLQRGLTSAATGLGKDTSGHLYDAGVNAAQGLVNGLKGGEKAIAAQMVRIGKLISATIRKELRMHSPSRLMHDDGLNVPLGLAGGIDAGAHHVESAAIRMVKPIRQPDLGAMAHAEATNRLAEVLARGGTRQGPLVHVERVDSGVDLELFARQAQFRERAGAFE